VPWTQRFCTLVAQVSASRHPCRERRGRHQILSDTVGACCKFLSHQDRSVVCNPVSIIPCQFCQLSCTQTIMSYVTKRNYVIGRCCLVVKLVSASVAHLKNGLKCSQIQSSLGFVHLTVSVSLCEHSPALAAADRQHLVNKVRKLLRSKNGARKSLGEKLSVLESFRRRLSMNCPTKDYIDLFWIAGSH